MRSSEGGVEVVSRRSKKRVTELVRRSQEARTCSADAPAAVAVFDVTDKGEDPDFSRLSPLHVWSGGVSVPGTGLVSTTVEGAWQGLKVFERQGADLGMLERSRSERVRARHGNDVRGEIRGHLVGDEVLGLAEARRRLYVPMYRGAVERHCEGQLRLLAGLVSEGWHVVLLDDCTNADVENVSAPLSHASILAQMVRELAASETPTPTTTLDRQTDRPIDRQTDRPIDR